MDGLHLDFFGVNMKKQWASLFIIFLLSGFLYSEEVGKLNWHTEKIDISKICIVHYLTPVNEILFLLGNQP